MSDQENVFVSDDCVPTVKIKSGHMKKIKDDRNLVTAARRVTL